MWSESRFSAKFLLYDNTKLIIPDIHVFRHNPIHRSCLNATSQLFSSELYVPPRQTGFNFKFPTKN